MPFEIVRNDITNMRVDAIVNTANPEPVVGLGVDAVIHEKAGPELLAARKRIGKIRVGSAAVTPAFRLEAKYVIHTVGPVWRGGGHGEEKLLRSCYAHSLSLARKLGCRSVAFPLIAAGNYRFPPELALQTALDAISAFLMKNEMQVYLAVFDRESFRLSEKLFRGITSYIDENYIQRQSARMEDWWESPQTRNYPRRMEREVRERKYESEYPSPMACPSEPRVEKRTASFRAKPSLEQLLEETDAGFSETLLKLIDRTGKKDAEVYTRANISRQHFSKIRNNPDYRPSKPTAVALAIALELDLEQTRDLIGRAGYALTNSSKFDVIVMYFIRERNYNMYDINAALFEFDQNLLGGVV